jgi:hypothetical protein
MARPTLLQLPRALSTLAAALVLAAAFSTTTPAHAGPTVSADLDLGTALGARNLASGTDSLMAPRPSPLYIVGFRVRAGWRFDIGPVWLLPEIGGGYDKERFVGTSVESSLPRAFGGARAGLSLSLLPGLRIEPAVYGHAGFAQYQADDNGTAFDVGGALDLRILRHLLVGVQVGYDVVTVWHPGSGQGSSSSGCPMNAFGQCAPTSAGASSALADRWLSYGLHAGVLFW